ncbi:hypothetical protein [Alkalihalobacterium alkalinitrilicum]|uniref:hypothetical protein n=1 Tax=Alkalihalobacterium alkalinitrilicum TaxID=427920 RepID=UPI0009954039|nr:hypothetical protein [Alkalihalobacterium alkalinitrilicum]
MNLAEKLYDQLIDEQAELEGSIKFVDDVVEKDDWDDLLAELQLPCEVESELIDKAAEWVSEASKEAFVMGYLLAMQGVIPKEKKKTTINLAVLEMKLKNKEKTDQLQLIGHTK